MSETLIFPFPRLADACGASTITLPARLPKLFYQFAQDKTLARARAAAKETETPFVERSKASRAFPLFIVELRIRRAGIRTPAGDNHRRPLSQGLDDFPFAQQNFPQGHFSLLDRQRLQTWQRKLYAEVESAANLLLSSK